MGRKRQERKRRQRARQAPEQKPSQPGKVPLEEWVVEEPFDSSVYLQRAALPPSGERSTK